MFSWNWRPFCFSLNVFMELLNRSSLSSHWKSFEDCICVGEIYKCPIFKRVVMTWLNDVNTSLAAPVIATWIICPIVFNTSRPRQNGRHHADDIFKCIFLNENVWIPIKISLKFVPTGPVNNIPALVQVMAWYRPCKKPSSEPTTVSLLTHICITLPQWVEWKTYFLTLSRNSKFDFAVHHVEQNILYIQMKIYWHFAWLKQLNDIKMISIW